MKLWHRLEPFRRYLWSRRKIIIIVIAIILCAYWYHNTSSENTDPQSQSDFAVNIPAYGQLPSLSLAMKENRDLRKAVNTMLSHDAAYLFANYKQINSEVARILFLWAGMDEVELKKVGGQTAVERFLRFVHGLPADEPIVNNPILGDNPWPNLFNRFKARLMMMGKANEIFDGTAYYDTAQDRFVITGPISEDFLKAFKDFLATLPSAERKSYTNNLLSFIQETKGWNNLSETEKMMLQELKG